MKPFSIVLSINLSFFAIWGLFFTLVVNRPELIPFFTSAQAAVNLLGVGIFYLDRKPAIMKAFIFGVVLAVAVTVGGYLLLNKYKDTIGIDEHFTAELAVPARLVSCQG
jgi:hypothetical protein